MLVQLELDGRAAAAVLGLESRDFTQTLQVMQVPCSHLDRFCFPVDRFVHIQLGRICG